MSASFTVWNRSPAQGVHDFLKRNPRVESFRMGGQGEGGLGATVVVLKQKGSGK